MSTPNPKEADKTLSIEEKRFIETAECYRSVPTVSPVAATNSSKSATGAQTRKTVYGPSGVSKKGLANLKAEGLRKIVENSKSRQAPAP
jgi:pyrroline-5-carboxylate reductase